MADLVVHEHRRCPGVYCEPETEKVEALKPDAVLTLRRASDLLGIPARDLDELLDSGALRSTADRNGRPAVLASDLQKFAGALRPVAFAETGGDDEDDREGEDDEEDMPTRRNPRQDDEPEGGFVRLRLKDLVAAIREALAPAKAEADAGEE